MRFLALILLLLPGCIPITIIRTPAASGTIIDDATGQPLVDAEVFISHANFMPPRTIDPKTGQEIYLSGVTPSQYVPPTLDEAIKEFRRPVIVTGSDGHFSIPVEKRFGFLVPALDVLPPIGSLVVRREGYLYEIFFVDSHDPVSFGQIRLRPLNPNPRYDYGRDAR